jgi:serine/threonine protein kinase
MATPTPWEEFAAMNVDEKYRLEHLVRGGSYRGIFNGYPLGDEAGERVSIQLFRLQDGQRLDAAERRFREAMFFDHPHLLRVVDVGTIFSGELLYVVSEKVDFTLPKFIENRPLPEPDALELTEQVVSALEYLHAENFIFCNLGLESVWRIGSDWKLADFSQLRVIGTGDRRELRPALSRLPGAPPEAFEGVVTPAWDVWSLGALLQRVLTPDPGHLHGSLSVPRGRYLRENALPVPFASIARDCLQPNPDARPALSDIVARISDESVTNARPPARFPETEGPQAEPVRSAPIIETEPIHTEPAAEEPPRREYAFPPYRGFDPEPRRATNPVQDRLRHVWNTVRAQPAGTRALIAFAAGILIVSLIAVIFSASNRRTTSAASTAPIAAEAERSRVQPSNAPPASFGSGTKESPAVPYEQKSGRDEDNIRAVLNRWLDTGRNRNAAAQADCYAPVVNTFYNRHRVSRSDIQREKQRQFDTIGPIHKLDVSNVQISQLSPTTSVILFDKTWDFGDRTKFSGSERAQLTLGKIDGQWKITGERELKVYHVHRSRHG